MALVNKHPQYEEYISDWEQLRDMYKGSRVVKSKGPRYLPPTRGMEFDGCTGPNDRGSKDYHTYKTRAVFHDSVREAVEHYVGTIWRKPPSIVVPKQMQYLFEVATDTKETVLTLARRITEEQLITGRCGILLDIRTDGLPYIVMYDAEKIVNWGDNFVILDESRYEVDDEYRWTWKQRARIVKVQDGVVTHVIRSADGEEEVQPRFRGRSLDKLPFIFINSKDHLQDPDNSPLIGLANWALSIYRSEADYRQNLFMQGQDTFVVIGGTRIEEGQPVRTGAGAMLEIEHGGDAKYVGVNSQGLAEQRLALERDVRITGQLSGKLLSTGNTRESGEALQTRVAAQTASMTQLSVTMGAALERLLTLCAEWMGLNAGEVSVTANTEFADTSLQSEELLKLVTARNMGLPLSFESIHAIMVEKGMTTLSYEEELERIQEENAGALALPVGPGSSYAPEALGNESTGDAGDVQ